MLKIIIKINLNFKIDFINKIFFYQMNKKFKNKNYMIKMKNKIKILNIIKITLTNYNSSKLELKQTLKLKKIQKDL